METATVITILLVDDHPLMRAGVRAVLATQSDFRIVAEADRGEQAIRLARQLTPDVVVLDMQMPDMDGLQVARRIRAENLPVRILALSAHDDSGYVSGLLESGASGYITKDKSASLIVEAVRAVARGEGRWFVHPPVRTDVDEFATITDREMEVLRLIGHGHTNAEVATLLGIAENTVKNHVCSLHLKTGATTSRELIAWAWQRGLVKE